MKLYEENTWLGDLYFDWVGNGGGVIHIFNVINPVIHRKLHTSWLHDINLHMFQLHKPFRDKLQLKHLHLPRRNFFYIINIIRLGFLKLIKFSSYLQLQ